MFIELLLKKFQALSRTWGYRGRQESSRHFLELGDTEADKKS